MEISNVPLAEVCCPQKEFEALHENLDHCF